MFGLTPSQSNFESLLDLASAGAMEEEGAAEASITPKTTKVWKMPKNKRKIGRYASRGKEQKIHQPLAPNPSSPNPPSQVSATLSCYVQLNSLLRISKAAAMNWVEHNKGKLLILVKEDSEGWG